MMDISKIHVNPKNPRIIKDGKFEKLCRSIQEFPKMLELRPIIVDSDGMILGGNMRFKALQYLKMDIKPEWVKEGVLSDEEKRRFVIEDNVGFGEWDWDELANAYGKDELEDWGLDVEKWAEDEIIEDEPPAVEDVAISITGEVYQLGNHRLMCGDATKIDDVEKLMDGQKADIAFTSPPYNVGKNAKLSSQDKRKENKYEKYNDENPEYLDLLNQSTALMLDKSDYVFVNLQQLAGNKRELIDWLGIYRDKFVDVMIWNKQLGQPSMAHKVLNCEFEFVYIFRNADKPNRAIGFKDFRGTLGNVYNALGQTKNDYSDIHAATFPVHFPSHFIKNFTNENQSVLDLFGGSGSTLIACEQTNRTCYMMELDPLYCDVIRKRYAKFIGKEEQWQTITPKIQ